MTWFEKLKPGQKVIVHGQVEVKGKPKDIYELNFVSFRRLKGGIELVSGKKFDSINDSDGWDGFDNPLNLLPANKENLKLVNS